VNKILAVLALSLIAACSNGPQDSELYGAWVATYENGSQTLTLEKDGTFVQEVRLKGSESPVVNSGTWQHHGPSNQLAEVVDLENCLGVNDGFGRIRADFATRRGGFSYPIERRFVFAGNRRLCGRFSEGLATLDLGRRVPSLQPAATGKNTDPVPIEKARHRLEARRAEQGREVARESDRRHPLSAERSPR
jgi:hypothetical protein